MKVLIISSDRNIFKEGSEAQSRMIEYGKLTRELHIVIFTKKETGISTAKISPNVYLYPTNSANRWFYVSDAVKTGKRVLMAGNEWLISSQDPFECGLSGWILKKKLGIPLQLQIHTDFLSPYFRKCSPLNCFRVLMAKFLIPRADCIRVVSARIKRSLEKLRCKPKTEPVVLPIFVDIENIKKAEIKTDLHRKYPQFDFIILMASRLTTEKNIGLAIDATKKIVRIHSKTGLIIVGEGPEEKKLKACSSKIKANVIFEPWTEDLASYYKTADLFLLISSYEGYGRTAVEAMAAGCPVIMTDVGLAGEVLIDKKDGIIVPVNNKRKLSGAILMLMENHSLRNELAKNSQKTMNFWPKKTKYLNDYREAWMSCKIKER